MVKIPARLVGVAPPPDTRAEVVPPEVVAILRDIAAFANGIRTGLITPYTGGDAAVRDAVVRWILATESYLTAHPLPPQEPDR